ncbi:MAG TPA: KH domain-containing protein [Xanthomonadales bacterium]|nr:KH domain-containing protein [Xanthomonadales bacterium]
MKDTLHYIVSAIVDDPDSVVIDEREVDGIKNYVVTVAKDDMGKVIGKEGKVIRSIRNIMKIKAMKTDVRINITLAEIPQE